MKRNRSPLLVALVAMALPAAASAEEMAGEMTTPPACTAPVAPTGELAPWTAPRSLNAAGDARQLAKAKLPVGRAADVTLLPTPEVKYPLRPEKPGGSVSYGGLIAVDIAEAGTYRVALGSGAWIDIVGKDGKAVVSTKHGHGPACSGVRKMVDFPLQPGRYTLQFAANGARDIRALVARLP